MLDKKTKKTLKAMANTKNSLFQIGKDGISLNMIHSLNDSLEAHELVKLNLLKTAPLSVKEAALDLSSATRSEIVMIIGHTFVLYRRSKENKLGL